MPSWGSSSPLGKNSLDITQDISKDDYQQTALFKSLSQRGGACDDSNPLLFLKIGTSAVVEAAAMFGFLKLGEYLTQKFPNQLQLPGGRSLSQVVAALGITMGSSLFGALADGGLSASTQQLLDPNVTPGDPQWYSNLKKPWWNPPGWLFPIMWLIIVKPTQAAAISRLMAVSSNPWAALGLFCGHLALGDAWNKVFFGMQCTGRGAAVISAFYMALVASVKVFWSTDSWAGKLLMPTLGWVSLATGLNWRIFFLNKK